MGRIALIAPFLVVLGCGDEPTVATVTVQPGTGVPALEQLRVTVAGETRLIPEDGGLSLPASFTITVPDGTESLQVTVEGLDPATAVRGFGREDVGFQLGQATETTIVLKTADFVISPAVDSEFRLATESPAGGGFQADGLGLTDGDQVVVAFTNGSVMCPGQCIGRARPFDAAGTPVASSPAADGASFSVYDGVEGSPDDAEQTVVAADGGRALFAWVAPGSDEVVVRGMDTTDWSFQKNVTDPVSETLATSRQDPSIDYLENDSFAVTWTEIPEGESERRVLARTIDQLGVPGGASVTLSADPMVQRPAVSLVGTSGDYVVAWRAFGGSQDQVKARYVTGAGPQPEVEITSASVISAVGVLGREDGTTVAAWAQGGQEGNEYGMQIFSSTEVISSRVVIAERQGAAASRPDLVATSATEIAVVYQNCPSECDIFMRRYRIANNTFEEISGEILVPADAVGDQRDPSIAAITSGSAVVSVLVAWTEETSDGQFRVEGRVVPLESP